MSLRTLFPSLWRSFYSKPLYQDVCQNWHIGSAFSYLSLLALIHFAVLWVSDHHFMHWTIGRCAVEASFNFIANLFMCLFYACIIMLWGAIFKFYLSYRQSYRLALVSITPFYFLHILTANMLSLPEIWIWGMGIFLQFTYLFLAAFANRPLPAEEEALSAPL